MIELDKNTIRKELNYLRDSLSQKEQHIANIAICKKLRQLQEIIYADTIAAYMPMKNEVDLSALFTECTDKQLCFPRYNAENSEHSPLYEMAGVPGAVFSDLNKAMNCFTTGKYGILEPEKQAPVIPAEKIDLWLIPGVGFDSEGNRLGRGGGFYDRLLKNASGIKIGIGYDIQLIKNVPCGEHDQRMDMVITQNKIIMKTKNKEI